MAIGIKEIAIIAGIILAIWVAKKIARERELSRRRKKMRKKEIVGV